MFLFIKIQGSEVLEDDPDSMGYGELCRCVVPFSVIQSFDDQYVIIFYDGFGIKVPIESFIIDFVNHDLLEYYDDKPYKRFYSLKDFNIFLEEFLHDKII